MLVPYTAHVTDVSVRSQTDQPPVSSLIQQRRLKLFGHIAIGLQLQRTTDVRYEHPLIASLMIGVAQEADLVSPGFEQSTVISNNSTLDFTLHCSKQRIVLPGGASWKRLRFSSVPPDDDDDDACLYMVCN